MASPNYNVEVVVKNACTMLGEGPHWDSNTQTLLFVDIEAMEVHRWDSVRRLHDIKKLSKTVGHVVPREKGGYVIGLGQCFAAIDWDSDNTIKTAELEGGVSTFRFNDGKCDAKGRLWGGTLSYVPGEGSDTVVHKEKGSLYRLDTDWTVSKHHSGLTISNGLAWTADNSVMFLVDSDPRKLHAFDFDLTAGTLSNQRTVMTFPGDTGLGEAYPDGMTIDLQDKLWIACWNGHAVVQLDPETGKMLQKINIPAMQPSSLCWGGSDHNELYVTSARKCTQEELDSNALNGSIFKVTGLGSKGHPAFSFQG